MSHPGTQSCTGLWECTGLHRAAPGSGNAGNERHQSSQSNQRQNSSGKDHIPKREGPAGEKPELQAGGGIKGGVKRAHPETFPGTRPGVPRPRAACTQDPTASVTGRSAGHLAGRRGTKSGPTGGRAGADSSPVAMVSLRCDTGAGLGTLRQTWPSGPAAGP